MGSQADTAGDREHAAWQAACLLGGEVYRLERHARPDELRVGQIERAEWGNWVGVYGGSTEPRPRYLRVVAVFPPAGGRGSPDWFSQTCEGHEFHLTRAGALEKLLWWQEQDLSSAKRDLEVRKLRVEEVRTALEKEKAR